MPLPALAAVSQVEQVRPAAPRKGVTAMAVFLARQMQKGRLRTADPVVAAHHLMSLLDSETVKPSLIGIQGPLTRKELRDATRRAVQVFLGGYAAEGRPAE